MTTVAIDPRTGEPVVDDYGDVIECLDDHTGDCRGEIAYRESLTGTGTRIPRCDHHWGQRLDKEEEHRAFEAWGRSEMDPADVGERWDDEGTNGW